jgi:hypothetical protein
MHGYRNIRRRDNLRRPGHYRVRARNARDHQNAFVLSAPHHHNAMGLEEALKECDTFVSEDDIP